MCKSNCNFTTIFCFTEFIMAIAMVASYATLAIAGDGLQTSLKVESKSPAAMIRDLRNRNTPPRLPRREAGIRSVFPTDYDWQEQSRVYKALTALHSDMRPDLVEEAIRNENNAKYCLTILDNGGNPRNKSVGDFCTQFVDARLTRLFTQHLSRGKTSPPHQPQIDIDLGISSFAKWRKRRSSKEIYELQIELCETAITKLKKVSLKDAARGDLELARKRIALEVQKLTKTKKPIFLPSSIGNVDLYYPPK